MSSIRSTATALAFTRLSLGVLLQVIIGCGGNTGSGNAYTSDGGREGGGNNDMIAANGGGVDTNDGENTGTTDGGGASDGEPDGGSTTGGSEPDGGGADCGLEPDSKPTQCALKPACFAKVPKQICAISSTGERKTFLKECVANCQGFCKVKNGGC